MKNRLLLTVGVLLALTIGALAGFGILDRYGSPGALWLRVRSEIVARRPHPMYVPTPLAKLPAPGATRTSLPSPAAPAGTVTGEPARLPSMSSPMPEATPRPSPAGPPIPGPSGPASEPAEASSPDTSGTPAPARASPSRLPSPTAVPAASATRAPAAPPPATQRPIVTPPADGLPASVRLTGLTHAWQAWNNCGPATLAMALSFFGRRIDQAAIAAVIRPSVDDKNVSPGELVTFARTQGLHALSRANGDGAKLRRLLAAGIPVLIETWHEPKPNNGMGHYRLLTGYDDAAGQWIAYDSYDGTGLVKGQPYAGIRLPYASLDAPWAVFNRQYVIIYDDAHAQAAERIVGADMDDAAMWRRALAEAEDRVGRHPQDPFAWFDLGTDLVAVGRFGDAAEAYDRARRIGLPWRMLWYQFGPFEAYYRTARYAEVIALADATNQTAQHVEELFFWRGLAQKAQGNLVAARADWRHALELNPNYALVRQELAAAGA